MILFLLAAQFGVAQEAIVVYESAETTHDVTNHPGNEYLWEVYKNFNPDVPADPTEFYFTGSNTGNIVTVHWVTAGFFYLKVTETDLEGCTNVKAMAISVIPNNRSIGFVSTLSNICRDGNDNSFILPLDILDNFGQELEAANFPVDVNFTVNGNSYNQSISYNIQELIVYDNMFSLSSGSNTTVLVEITQATDKDGVGISPLGNKRHTRTIFATPEIEFTGSPPTIVQGTIVTHNVQMIRGNLNIPQYTWVIQPANGTSTDLNFITTNSADIIWDGPIGAYSLSVYAIDGNGCLSETISQQIEIVEPDDLIVYAGNDTTIGSCNPYQLEAWVSDTTGLSYLWEPANNLSDATLLNPVITTGDSTTFILTVTHSSGILVKDTVTIDIDEIYADAGEDLIVEKDATAILDASASFGKDIQYSWTTLNGIIVSGENTANPLVNGGGTYVLEIVDSYACSDSDSVIVTDNPLLVYAGNDTLVGACNPYQLQASVSDTIEFTYLWKPGENLDAPTILNPVFTPGITTTFILTVTHSSGITIKDTVTIEVDEIYADAGEDLVIEKDATAMLDGSASVGRNIQYQWVTRNGTIDSGENTANPIVSGAGTYYVEVTDFYGCTASDSMTVSWVFYAPIANDDYDTTAFQTAVNIPVLANDEDPNGDLDPTTLAIVQYPVNGSVYINYDDYSVTYTPTDGFTGGDVFEYKICNLTNQCDNAHVYILVISIDFLIPEAFTPNGDNINDYFEIEGIDQYLGNSITIINRWGKKIFEARNYGIDTSPKFWDGKWAEGSGDKNVPTGTYFYILDLGNGQKPIAGSIYIDR